MQRTEAGAAVVSSAPSLYQVVLQDLSFSRFNNDFAFSAYLPEELCTYGDGYGVMSGVMHAR